MSTTWAYVVRCDEPDCDAWTVSGGLAPFSSAGARSEAADEGWSYRGYIDRCPTHTREARCSTS